MLMRKIILGKTQCVASLEGSQSTEANFQTAQEWQYLALVSEK